MAGQKPRLVTVTGVGSSNWVNIDCWPEPVQFAGVARVTSGTATYDIEYTYDDLDYADGNPRPVPSNFTAQTGEAEYFSEYPVMGIRATITAGTGTVELTVLQSGGRG